MRQLDLFDSLNTTDLDVRKVSLSEATLFYQEHHYLRGCSNSAMAYAVYKAGESRMIACVAFQTPVSENVRCSVFGPEYKRNVAELGRLAICPTVNIQASSFMSRVIKAYANDRQRKGLSPISALISFADTAQGHHGGVYQAMSWTYTGQSLSYSTVYTDPTGRRRHRRQNGSNITAGQARCRGWTVAGERGIKHRYIKILGSKRHKRKMKKILCLEVLPYPKD